MIHYPRLSGEIHTNQGRMGTILEVGSYRKQWEIAYVGRQFNDAANLFSESVVGPNLVACVMFHHLNLLRCLPCLNIDLASMVSVLVEAVTMCLKSWLSMSFNDIFLRLKGSTFYGVFLFGGRMVQAHQTSILGFWYLRNSYVTCAAKQLFSLLRHSVWPKPRFSFRFRLPIFYLPRTTHYTDRNIIASALSTVRSSDR